MSNIKATFPCNLQSVWQVVTSLTDYSWRSDVEKIEVISDTQFVEITKSGYKTTFTVTRQEPCCRWEFDMENDKMKGHWVGIFSGNEKNATIDFTERIEPKKWFMIPFVKIYLKYWQARYVRDLRNVLKKDDHRVLFENRKAMPQITKGGKFIFGISHIREDLTIQIPKQAIHEYALNDVKNIILITGSKATGGFCITTYPLLSSSKLCHILTDCPQLREQTLPMGKLITYKGRGYTWVPIGEGGMISLTTELMRALRLQVHSELLAIRSSNIAFTMGAKGPLWGKAQAFNGEITRY